LLIDLFKSSIMKKVIITSPNLDPNYNVSGVSAVTGFIIRNNPDYKYQHFELGKIDGQKRGLTWFLKNIKVWCLWFWLMVWSRKVLIHFNIALNMRSVIRDIPLVLVAQFLNKKIIIHLHGGEYLEKTQTPKWAAFLIRTSLSGKKPKIVLSHLEKELVINRFHARNVHVVSNCIDLNEAAAFNGIKNWDLPLNILFIGRIDRNKGLDYIYQGFSILKEKENTNFRFIMAGSGPDKEEFVNKFTNLLGPSFEYKGVITGQDKTDLLKNCNLFLLPSLYEGLPISLLENMSFGNVPVVTNVGSVGSVVTDGKNGIIVSIGSAEEIAKAIETLSTDTNILQQMSANARKHIFKHFNPQDYIKKLNSIYYQVANRKEISDVHIKGFITSNRQVQV